MKELIKFFILLIKYQYLGNILVNAFCSSSVLFCSKCGNTLSAVSISLTAFSFCLRQKVNSEITTGMLVGVVILVDRDQLCFPLLGSYQDQSVKLNH